MTESALAMLAERAARAAGTVLLAHSKGTVRGIGAKSSATDPVSDADREAERTIVDVIHAARPDDAIVGEEGAAVEGASGLRWLVDPLDGTVNFLYRYPQWAVSVACLDAEGALAGVVYDPLRDEAFVGARGEGAHLAGRRLGCTALEDPAAALVSTGFSYVAAERALQARRVASMIGHVRDIRRAGSAALDLAWVAAGRTDAYVELVVNPWDWAAGALLVREAGGRVTEVPGVRSGLAGIVASGPGLHDALVELVERANRLKAP
ncbi:MAG: inositol monophosphatase family protein [Candidatus Limnocylindria bacterium]